MSAGRAGAPTKLVDVAVGVLLRPDGSLLLGQRPVGKPYAGWWELPGGKIEPGETTVQALARELDEELGIRVTQAAPWVTHVHAYTHATVRLFFCRVTGWEGEPRGLESQDLRWVRTRPATPADTQAAIADRLARQAALSRRREAGDALTDVDQAQADALDPAEALGLALEPAIGLVLPATLPPLRWLTLPTRYAITGIGGPDAFEAFLPRLRQALEGGLRLLQWREPDWPDGPASDSLRDALVRTLALTRAAGATLLVNSAHPADWWRLADGVHLRSRDLARAPRKDASLRWLAASTHDAAELALARERGADFAVLGPVLPTPSHPGATPLGWDAFTREAAFAGLPVFALGGQSGDTLATAQAHGAHGVAGIRGFIGRA